MLLDRRRFFQALAASALTAGVDLPIGLPRAKLKRVIRPDYGGFLVPAKYVDELTGIMQEHPPFGMIISYD